MLPQAVIGKKELKLVLEDWAAEIYAKLVPPLLRFCRIVISYGVEVIILEIVIRLAVELV